MRLDCDLTSGTCGSGQPPSLLGLTLFICLMMRGTCFCASCLPMVIIDESRQYPFTVPEGPKQKAVRQARQEAAAGMTNWDLKCRSLQDSVRLMVVSY